MCRAKNKGDRRCNEHNPYGIERRNLQAQKQYHANKLKQSDLTDKQRKRSQDKLDSVTSRLDGLLEEKQSLGTVTPYVMNLTPHTERVLNQLEEDGFKPYIVGGSVRDVLMGLDNKDVDIEVYGGQPDSIAASLRKIGNVDEVGKSFGVLKIRIGSEDFDVSLPRIDSKSGDGHRGFEVEVDPDLSLEEATARRDYTINALMYSHRLGFIIDQHGGLADLENKQLRHVSEAFDEDPLRVLRGVQMASRFSMDLHPDTVVKAQTLQDEYKSLAVERVQIEFQKLYEKGKSPDKALKLLKATQWDKNFPGLAAVNDDDLHEDLRRTQNLIDTGVIGKDKRAMFLSAMIAHRLSDRDRNKFLSSTTVGSDTKNAADKLSQMKAPGTTTKADIRAWAYEVPRNLSIRDWTTLEKAKGNHAVADDILAKAEKLNVADNSEPDLIKGEDIIALNPGKRPGPWMREALDSARSAQYSDVFRSRDSALSWAKKNLS